MVWELFWLPIYSKKEFVSSSVAEPGVGAAGATGAATFREAPEPEPIFLLIGAESRSRTF